MKARFFAIAALVLGLASCQRDFAPEGNVGGEVDFRLEVSAPELGATRADADAYAGHDSAYGAIDYLSDAEWAEVDLRYILEVYDVEADYTNATPIKDRQVIIVDKYEPVKFEVRLAPQRDYHFVVFADFVAQGATNVPTVNEQAEIGLRHNIGATLGDITIKADAINDELADAYFATLDYTPNNNVKNTAEPIVLRRPYGKVRVVATDLNELNLNVEPRAVRVAYNAYHANAFNAVNGKISGEYVKEFYDYGYADLYKNVEDGGLSEHLYTEGYDAMTAESNTGVERHTHMTLFTDYILAENVQSAIQFTMSVYDVAVENIEGAQPIKTTAFNTQIPVQRNYLTTIIGNVLTTATDINVSIDDNFDGFYNPDIVFVGNAEQLQEAIDNYVDGQTILFDADIKGDVIIHQYIDKNYYINGNGYKYDGVIEINGNARQADPDSVTLQNINFETAKTSINVIDANENKKYGNSYNYAHNITIKDCTFNLGEGSVGMKFRQSKNIVVENCKMVAGHSLMQLYGVNGVVVDNANVEAKNGLALGTSTGVKVKNSTIVATGYGLRGEPNGDVTVENSTIEAMLPIVARNLDKAEESYAVSVDADSELVAPGYQVVFTAGDDDTLIVPAGTFSIDRSDLLVFPGEKLFAYNASQLQYLLDNATGDTTIELVADIEGNVMAHEIDGCTVTIEGRGHSYNGYIQINGKTKYADATTVFSNINFVTNGASALLGDAFIYCGEGNGTSYRYPDNVTIKGCTFTASDAAVEKSVAAKFWSINGNLVVENCSADKLHSMIQLTSCSKANVTIDGAVIANGKNGISLGDAGEVLIKNANIAAREYGVRADGAGEYVLNIEDSNIAANLPVVARKVKANYTINFTGDNTLTTAEEYQVVFTTGNDDATFVAPAAYSHTGAYDFKVFPELDVRVDNVDDLNSAINNHNGTITVEAPITTNYLQIDDANEVVLNFEDGATLNSGTAGDYAVISRNKSEVTINNLDVKASAGGVAVTDGSKLIFNGKAVKVGQATTSGRYNFYVVNNSEAVINGGEFSFTTSSRRAYVYVAAGSKVVINGGTFGKASTRSDYAAGILGDGEVIIYGGTFGFDPSNWVAEGYQAVYDSATKTWTVQ